MERDHLPPNREWPDDVETIPLDGFEVRSYVGTRYLASEMCFRILKISGILMKPTVR